MAARLGSLMDSPTTTEGASGRKATRRSQSGASLSKMAWANLGRSRGKTAITITSLSLAALLLNMTVTFTNGFDMDKYLSNVVSDFIVADAGYFQVGALWNAGRALPEAVISGLEAQPGVEAGGRI